MHVFATQLRQRQAAKRFLAGNQFIKDETETVDVRATVDFRTAVARQLAPLFRRHVIRSAQHLTGDREICIPGLLCSRNFFQLGDSQIEQLNDGLATGRRAAYHYVFGFEIAMHDAHRVRRVQHAHNWLQHRYGFRRREASVLSPFGVERVALDVFHDQVDRAIARGAEIVDRDRVGMTKAPRRLAFALKTTQPFGVAAHLWRQDLDRDAVAQQDMARAIDGAHAAFAQHGLDLVLAIKRGADERRWIFFENFAVLRAKAQAVVKLFFADRAVLHSGISLQRRAIEGRITVRSNSQEGHADNVDNEVCAEVSNHRGFEASLPIKISERDRGNTIQNQRQGDDGW